MTQQCPVCDEPTEHVRSERSESQSSLPTQSEGPTSTIDVGQLCATDTDVQWDRICHRAVLDEQAEETRPMLEVYYHFFGDDSAGDNSD